jgi:ferric hydroxamate transport system substrate-binding protein
MPADVIDVGLRLEPNLELMQSLQPDLILINPAEFGLRTVLAPLAPIQMVRIYGDGGEPLVRAREATHLLARLVEAEPAADAFLEQVDAAMADARQRLRAYDGRPLYVIGFIDEQRVGVAGRSSLFEGVLDVLGLRNAWQGAANGWGAAVVGVERLLPAPEARLVYLTPWTGDPRMTVTHSQLWKRLPFVQAGRVVALPAVFAFGALPSAIRFAQLLSEALSAPSG